MSELQIIAHEQWEIPEIADFIDHWGGRERTMRIGYIRIGRRIFWLTYGIDILCPSCRFYVIPIEEVWCGCKIKPRKLKKWCKGRREAYNKEAVIV